MAAIFDPILGKLRSGASSGGGGSTAWGSITGTLSSQTDLQTALNAKQGSLPLTTKGDILVHTGAAYARQAVGTDGYGLIADSTQTNGIKWDVLPPTEFETTVGNSAVSGSTGVYTTFNAAVGAGKRRIKIVGGTTETTSTTLLDKMYISADDQAYTINMQGNNLTTTNGHLYWIDNLTIAHDNLTTGTECFTNASYRLLATNCIFDNNATSDGETTFGCTSANTAFMYCRFQGARQDFFTAIPNASSGTPTVSVIDCVFVGEGVNARVSIGTSNNAYAEITGIYVRGTYAATALRLSGQAVNVFANGLGVSVSIDANATVNTLKCAALTVGNNQIVVNNVNITSLTLNNSASRCSFTNVYNSGNTTINSGSNNNSFTTTYFGGSTLTDSGNNNKISSDDCQFAGFTNGVVAKVTAASDTADWKLTRHFDCTSNAITCNLPAAANCKDREYKLIKTDASANAVTIDPNGSETINGSSTASLLTQNSALIIQSDGANWYAF